MTCAEFERTSAYLDGELDASASADAERHIEGCPHCQALVAAAGEASEALRGRASRLRAPASLRARIARSLDQEETKVVRLSSARPARRQFWLGAVSGMGASGIAAAVALAVIVLPAAESQTSALVDDHVRALSSGQVIEVVSSNHHTVKPWFAGRAPLSPPVNDFAAEGFSLAGGRVGAAAGGKAAVVVYRHGAHEIDLYVWPSRGLAPPSRVERRGYHVVTWRDRDLTLAAVSDVQSDELDRFVHLVRAAKE
jgi:anti-sigma factor RsiW